MHSVGPFRPHSIPPAITLEACLDTDFSSFETFDNYCYAMFTLDQYVADDDHLSFTSPRFLDAVAARDDIFEVAPFSRVTFNRDRFDEKVMRRWDEMQVREFRTALPPYDSVSRKGRK